VASAQPCTVATQPCGQHSCTCIRQRCAASRSPSQEGNDTSTRPCRLASQWKVPCFQMSAVRARSGHFLRCSHAMVLHSAAPIAATRPASSPAAVRTPAHAAQLAQLAQRGVLSRAAAHDSAVMIMSTKRRERSQASRYGSVSCSGGRESSISATSSCALRTSKRAQSAQLANPASAIATPHKMY